MANRIPIAGGGKEICKEKPPRITSEDFNQKTRDQIEKEKKPEDLPIKRLSLFQDKARDDEEPISINWNAAEVKQDRKHLLDL